jgi:hypothetical protein
MRRTTILGLSLILGLGLAGCKGGSDKHERVIKDMVDQMNSLADALESVKDKASAKEAAVKINKICDRLTELGNEAKSLPKITKSEDDRLMKKYEPEMNKATERLKKVTLTAAAKCDAEPDFMKSLERLEKVGNTFQNLDKQ